MKRLALLFVFAMAGKSYAAEGPCVMPNRGHFQIHTGTSGLFGAFAHDHLIEAKSVEGCATIDSQNPAKSSIKLTFTTANIKVVDPKESPEDRAKVQKTMETDVLRVSEFPRITFESSAVEKGTSTNSYRVRGNLTIRGNTQPVTVPVALTKLQDGTYRVTGEYRFKQTAFGIKPVQLAGGTVKVKDELRTEFELFLK